MVETKIGYDLWANKQVCNQLKKIENVELLAETTRLLTHLLRVQVVWYNRMYNIHENINLWGEFDLQDCQSLMNDSRSMLEGIAKKIGTSIAYKNSKGESFTDAATDIFEHIIIHGQHHRAQIFLLLRQAGITPPATDYIFYPRML